MPWKFVCDLWFHEVLQTTIVYVYVKIHAHVCSHTHTLNTTYTSTHNNTQL